MTDAATASRSSIPPSPLSSMTRFVPELLSSSPLTTPSVRPSDFLHACAGPALAFSPPRPPFNSDESRLRRLCSAIAHTNKPLLIAEIFFEICTSTLWRSLQAAPALRRPQRDKAGWTRGDPAWRQSHQSIHSYGLSYRACLTMKQCRDTAFAISTLLESSSMRFQKRALYLFLNRSALGNGLAGWPAVWKSQKQCDHTAP